MTTSLKLDAQTPAAPVGLLGLLFVLALAARLAILLLDPATTLLGDEHDYDALARGLLQTGGLESRPGSDPLVRSPVGQPTAYRAPLFPAFLAAVYSMVGHSVPIARIFLCLANALGCVVVALLARRLLPDWGTAVLTGGLWALWPASLIGGSTALLTEPLLIPLQLLSMMVLARQADVRRDSALFLAGLLVGLCALARANAVLLVPGVIAWLWFTSADSYSTRLKQIAVFGLGAVLLVGPWVWRNHARLGTFALTTQTDALFLGNNAWARGSYDGEFYAGARSQQVRWLLSRHPSLPELNDGQKAKIFTREAVDFALEHPHRMAWLIYRKAVLFWSPLRDASAGYWLDPVYLASLPFFAVGFARTLKKRDRTLMLLLVPVAVAYVSCLIVFFMPRYRLPAEPFMLILAMVGAATSARRFGPKRVALLALLLVVGGLLVGTLVP